MALLKQRGHRMLKIAVTGATGRMGKEVIAAIHNEPKVTLAAALTRQDNNLANKDFSVLIDFSSPLATETYLQQCVQLNKPMVIGTTGLSAAQKEAITKAAAVIPIVFAPNMSLGVNLCYNILGACAKALGNKWQVAISDLHHQHKKDSPSGTALKMGEIITKHGNITKDKVQFNSIRAGDIVGEHTVMFIGDGERIEITHKASNRQAFAKGALTAALWLSDKGPGLYTMQDVV